MRPSEEQRDVAMLDHGGADTVGKAGQLLEAVGVKPPVPGVVDDLLHVQDGEAQLLAVAAGRAKLEDAEPGQSVDDVDHVENHRGQDVHVVVIE